MKRTPRSRITPTESETDDLDTSHESDCQILESEGVPEDRESEVETEISSPSSTSGCPQADIRSSSTQSEESSEGEPEPKEVPRRRIVSFYVAREVVTRINTTVSGHINDMEAVECHTTVRRITMDGPDSANMLRDGQSSPAVTPEPTSDSPRGEASVDEILIEAWLTDEEVLEISAGWWTDEEPAIDEQARGEAHSTPSVPRTDEHGRDDNPKTPTVAIPQDRPSDDPEFRKPPVGEQRTTTASARGKPTPFQGDVALCRRFGRYPARQGPTRGGRSNRRPRGRQP